MTAHTFVSVSFSKNGNVSHRKISENVQVAIHWSQRHLRKVWWSKTAGKWKLNEVTRNMMNIRFRIWEISTFLNYFLLLAVYFVLIVICYIGCFKTSHLKYLEVGRLKKSQKYLKKISMRASISVKIVPLLLPSAPNDSSFEISVKSRYYGVSLFGIDPYKIFFLFYESNRLSPKCLMCCYLYYEEHCQKINKYFVVLI